MAFSNRNEVCWEGSVCKDQRARFFTWQQKKQSEMFETVTQSEQALWWKKSSFKKDGWLRRPFSSGRLPQGSWLWTLALSRFQLGLWNKTTDLCLGMSKYFPTSMLPKLEEQSHRALKVIRDSYRLCRNKESGVRSVDHMAVPLKAVFVRTNPSNTNRCLFGAARLAAFLWWCLATFTIWFGFNWVFLNGRLPTQYAQRRYSWLRTIPRTNGKLTRPAACLSSRSVGVTSVTFSLLTC